jgi:hypothetical protein
MMEKPIPDEISKQLFRWNMVASFHRAAYVILGLIGVLCPLVVASFADVLETWQVRLLSFAASAAIAIFAAFEIGNLTTRWREAWKHLNAARLEYEVGVIEIDDLVKAYREGEAIIGKMRPDVFAETRKDKQDGARH